MLHEFITAYRDPIIARTREKLTDRPWALVSKKELEHGVPLFLSQLTTTLQLEIGGRAASDSAIGLSATEHGRELQALGFTISQVVHDYGDICQAITEIALEQKMPITTEEFNTLNRCLDLAIAQAVTEYARITAESRTKEETERTGQLAHEIRDVLNSAVLAFNTLKLGTVAVNGSTGTILGRSLMNLRDLVDNTLSDVRMDARIQRREQIHVPAFLCDIAAVAHLHAQFRSLKFGVEPVDPDLAIIGDPQLLAAAVMNLLNNAFKFTQAGGKVTLRAMRHGEHLRIEVEDECGGIGDAASVIFQPFTGRRQTDRSGLGLGLSIARKAVKVHNGDIRFHNLPGKGCVFVIELPVALGGMPQSAAMIDA